MKPDYRSPGHIKKLLDLIARCEQKGDLRLLKRAKGVLWYLKGKRPEEIARLLGVGLRSIYHWLARYRERGLGGLYEGTHPGRPPLLSRDECERLGEILEAGPYAYGFRRGGWSSSLVQEVIRREFGVRYHRDHVRKILHRLGFSFVGLGKKMASGRKESRPRWIRKHRVGRRICSFLLTEVLFHRDGGVKISSKVESNGLIENGHFIEAYSLKIYFLLLYMYYCWRVILLKNN